MGDKEEVTLYYNSFSNPSRKVLTALYEKNVKFLPHHLRLEEWDQLEIWYLKMHPKGQVPLLKHGNNIIIESTEIMEYIDETFGTPNQLFPENPLVKGKVKEMLKKIDQIPTFPLTYGAVVFFREEVTDKLRWQYDDPAVVEKFKGFIFSAQDIWKKKAIEFGEMESGKIMANKAESFNQYWPFFKDKDMYLAILGQVEALLDHIGKELSSPSRLGPWLCSPSFSAADIAFSCLLFRLHQIGMDDKLWKDGIRPAIAVYSQLAFDRESLERATEVNNHKNNVYHLAQKGKTSIQK